MSNVIDNKIVEMKFDNTNFEKNVETSISTLSKLKKSLKLNEATEGFKSIGSAAKQLTLSPIGNAVDKIGLKFNWMYSIADQSIRNITNSAYAAGKKIVSSLTIDPVKTGFQEYETQINAIQTILANTKSKGSTLTDVNKALDELNTYADKTIYNFTEMTRNIGAFTAAGVDLETSVSSIKGIANLAAVSGSSSAQASNAMYQLSQALASGRVSLMDWNSVVNAGMGGQVFQDALKRTAKNMGINVDAMIEKYGSFRESLTKGEWLTTEVLTETLTQLSGSYTKADLIAKGYTEQQAKEIMDLADTAVQAATKVKTFTQLFDTLKEAAQSGWTKTWEIIIGDFEEAKSLMTDISEVIGEMIGKSADARNKLLQGWKDAGGRTDLIEGLSNVFKGILSIINPIKEGFREIFPPITVNQLVEFTRSFKELTSKLVMGNETADKIKTTFKGFFTIFKIGGRIISAVFDAIKPLFENFGNAGSNLLDLGESFGLWMIDLDNTIEKTDLLNTAVEYVNKGIERIKETISNTIPYINKFVDGIKDIVVVPFVEGFEEFFTSVRNGSEVCADKVDSMKDRLIIAFEHIKNVLYKFKIVDILESIWNGILKLYSTISRLLGSIVGSFSGMFVDLDFTRIFNVVKAALTGGILLLISKFVKSMKEAVDQAGGFFEFLKTFLGSAKSSSLKESIVGVLNGVKDSLSAFQTQLKANAIKEIAKAVAILAASLFVISIIDSDKLLTSLGAITSLFIELMTSMAILGKVSAITIKDVMSITIAMKGIAVSVLILASALKIISSSDNDGLLRGLIGIVSISAIMIIAIKALESCDTKNALKGVSKMIVFALAIKILVSALKIIATMNYDGLLRGIIGIASLSSILVLVIKALESCDTKNALKGVSSMIALAVAIKILASACKDMASLNFEELAKGLIGTIVLLGSLAGFTYITKNATKMISVGIGIIAVSVAIKILASACKDMAVLDVASLIKGLISVVTLLIALSAVTVITNGSKLISVGIGMIAVALAMKILAGSLKDIGSMSWEELIKGLIGVTASLYLLAGALALMKNSLAGSAALVVAVIALNMLTPVLKALGAMSWESIGKSLIALAGAFAVIGVAGLLIGPLVPVILSLSASMFILGVSVTVIGAGLLILATGIGALAAAVSGGASVIVATLEAIIIEFFTLMPKISMKIAEAIIEFSRVLIKGAPIIGKAVVSIILTIVEMLTECVPVIVDGLAKLLLCSMEALTKYGPKLVDLLFVFIISIINGLANRIPDFINAIVNLFSALFSGILNVLNGISKDDIMDTLLCVGALTAISLALAGLSAILPAAMLGVLGLGAIAAELSVVLAALGALSQIPGLEWFINEGGNLLQSIGTCIGKFVGGVAEGVSESFPDIGANLSAFMTNIQPFIEGIKSIDASVLAGAAMLSGTIALITGSNIIGAIGGFITGDSSMETFSKELVSFGEGLKDFSIVTSGINGDSIKAAAEAAKALADMASTVPNEGGVVGWFAGENSIAKFGTELISLGVGLKGFSIATSGINGDSIKAASEAAKALTDMASTVPNEGGVVGWFAGENSIAKFGTELISLGVGLKGFSIATSGINGDSIKAAAEAAKALADMASTVPNEGGVVGWFAGENSIAKFGTELVMLGTNLKLFSVVTTGINTESVQSVATAAKALADMASTVPNEGGIVGWFAGENSIAKFGTELVMLGTNLKLFSVVTTGINTESVQSVATAAKALADMASTVPNEGGIVGWFAGENSIAKFGTELISLGVGLKGFSIVTSGINGDSIKAAAEAAKALTDMASTVPNEGGVVGWFAGENSIAKFGTELISLGVGLKGFADNVTGIDTAGMSAATTAAEKIADMTTKIPTEGGIKAWFSGETSIAKFGTELISLGVGLKGFAVSVAGIDTSSVTAAASAGKSLAEMAKIVPSEGGIKAWFSGDSGMASFSSNLPTLGEGIKGFSDKVTGIDCGAVKSAATAAKTLAEMTKTIPDDTSLTSFGSQLKAFGVDLNVFSQKASSLKTDMMEKAATTVKSIATKVAGINSSGLSNAIEQVKKLTDLAKKMSSTDFGGIASMEKSLGNIGKNGVNNFISAFNNSGSKVTSAVNKFINSILQTIKNSNSKFKTSGESIVSQIINGINGSKNKLTNAMNSSISSAVTAIRDKYQSFYNAGSYLVTGFVNGINDNMYKAKAKASAMANAAKIAAEKALDEHSPSKEFYRIGAFAGIGFINALSDYESKTYNAGESLADSVKVGFSRSIDRIRNVINSDMDMQPRIRPVIDMSDVENGVSSINNMLSFSPSTRLMSNIGTINSMMNNRIQNGSNADVVSAIDKLRKDLGNVGGTTNIVNGITYDDGSNISDAVGALIRAARIERRV